MTRIFHITTDERWQGAKRAGMYLPEGFHDDGFIHCSYAAQVPRVANALFRGRTGLVLLEIEPSLVECEVIDEKPDEGRELFPHVYGPLPCSAVVAVHSFPCDEDGLFRLPKGVSPAHIESGDRPGI